LHWLPLQCPIIHGLWAGKLLVATDSALSVFRPEPEQQLHDAACRFVLTGSFALRSLTALARRRAVSIPAKAGAVNSARGATSPHCPQHWGCANSAIGRTAVNGPQPEQRYS
jgi:hypothetical protein